MSNPLPRLLTVALAATLILGRPAVGRAHNGGEEFGLAISAAAANLLYTPAKVIVASVGMVIGGFTGMLTGGDTRAAYAVLVPAASGTFILTSAHLDGTEPIEFFGSDYADQAAARSDTGGLYDAQYSR